MLFKFWKWRIEIKVRNLDADKQIVFLAQELLKAVVRSGRKLQTTSGMGSFDINVYKHNNSAEINCIINGWKVQLGKNTYIEWDQKEKPSRQRELT